MPGPASLLGAISHSHDGCSPEPATLPNPSKVLIMGILPMLAPGPWHPNHESCSPNTPHCCHPIVSVMGHPRVLVDRSYAHVYWVKNWMWNYYRCQ